MTGIWKIYKYKKYTSGKYAPKVRKGKYNYSRDNKLKVLKIKVLP
jgi:hypothetical protein